MSQYGSIEAYAEHVRRETSGILARVMMKFGPEHEVALTIGGLCTEAAGIVQQSKMQQEQAGGYDLRGLAVEPDKASNSETLFEED